MQLEYDRAARKLFALWRDLSSGAKCRAAIAAAAGNGAHFFEILCLCAQSEAYRARAYLQRVEDDQSA